MIYTKLLISWNSATKNSMIYAEIPTPWIIAVEDLTVPPNS